MIEFSEISYLYELVDGTMYVDIKPRSSSLYTVMSERLGLIVLRIGTQHKRLNISVYKKNLLVAKFVCKCLYRSPLNKLSAS